MPVATTMSSITEHTEKALRQSEALLEGQFWLSSGRHAGRYVQCARLLQYTDLAAQVCDDLANKIRQQSKDDKPFDVVIGPAMGAVTFSYELARAFGVRGLFAERAAEGGFDLRRGFEIKANERVLVAEDVVTTGKSAGEVVTMLREMGVINISAASIVNRSGIDNPFGDDVNYYSCIEVEVPSYAAAECPLCESGEHGEAYKPGSRPNI